MSCSTTTTECVLAMSRSSSAVSRGLLVGHAGGRLVDQQQLGLLHQQHADLEPLLLAVGQLARLAVTLLRQAGSRSRMASIRSRSCAVRRANSVRERARFSFSASKRFLEHRVLLEHGRRLELAADAELGDRRLVERGQIDASGRTSASPASGRVLPVITSIIVVLPAPFGPMMRAARRGRSRATAHSARGSRRSDTETSSR